MCCEFRGVPFSDRQVGGVEMCAPHPGVAPSVDTSVMCMSGSVVARVPSPVVIVGVEVVAGHRR